MFGRDKGNKKETQKPFRLQVLTTNYIIDGTVPGDTYLYFPAGDMKPLVLENVRIRAALLGGPPDHTCPRFSMTGGPAVVLVPEIDPHDLVDWPTWKLYDEPHPGVFHAGPYRLEGTFMFMRRDTLEEEMPILDVRIRGAVPEAAWGQIEAPFALLNTHWLHGWEHA